MRRAVVMLTLAGMLAACVPDRSPTHTKACKMALRELVTSPSTLNIINVEPGLMPQTVDIEYDVQNAFGGTVRNKISCGYRKKQPAWLTSIKLNGSYISMDASLRKRILRELGGKP